MCSYTTQSCAIVYKEAKREYVVKDYWKMLNLAADEASEQSHLAHIS